MIPHRSGRIRHLGRAFVGLAVFVWLSFGVLASVRAAEPESSSVRRFALLVGANDGGGEREVLRYAGTDADMFGKALTELGGLDKSDRVVLGDPDVAGLERGFADVRAKIDAARRAGERVQFVFYYSGHSDETGLLLGGVHVDYKRLRALIDAVPADVRIAILDSCSSGAFTRFKGGKKREPFLIGTAAEVEGHAYLTSSSADEVAQESDRIGGSFFTHYLVTGLRGAADFDGDRRVTLSEAYRFAFDETLARTEATSGGPQHAAYEIKLAGTGDLVMTDLRKTSAKLELAPEIHGRVYIRDRRGNLAAELFKPKGSGTVVLALEPGNYAVTIDDGRNLHRAEVEVRSNKIQALKLAGLEGIPIEGTRLRGDAPAVDRRLRPPPPPGGYVHVPFNVGVSPKAEVNGGRANVRNNISLSFGASGSAVIEGFQAGIGAAWATDYVIGLQASVGASVSHGPFMGVQAAIGGSVAKADFRGFQSGIVALGYERVAGLQMGYGYGYAGTLRGVQLGVVNVAGEAKGLQAGLVNVSKGKVEGLQIGLVNVADEADGSIALVPYTKQGGVWFDVWTSDVQLVHAALRFRARKTYGFLTAGIHPIGDTSSKSLSGGVGFGGPLVWRRFVSLELDNSVSVVTAGYTQARAMVDTLRLAFAWRPARHFSVFAAVTANLMVDLRADEGEFRPGYDWGYELVTPTTTSATSAISAISAKIWPGFAFGFEF